jgi:hypothetical protein
MHMKPIRIFPALSLVLLLAKEGHMSSGIEKIALADLAGMSDAILLVKKDVPYRKVEKLPFPDAAHGHFQAASHRYRILKVIRDSEGAVKGKKIQVFSAHVEDNFEQTRRELEGKPVAMTILPTYSPAGSDPEKDPNFIIFVRYNRNAKRFSFAAAGAMEKAGRLEEIKSIAEGEPPKSP